MDLHFDALLDALLHRRLDLNLHLFQPIEKVTEADPVPGANARCSEPPRANLCTKALNPDRCRTAGEGAKMFNQLVWSQKRVRVGRGISVHSAADRTGRYGLRPGEVIAGDSFPGGYRSPLSGSFAVSIVRRYRARRSSHSGSSFLAAVDASLSHLRIVPGVVPYPSAIRLIAASPSSGVSASGAMIFLLRGANPGCALDSASSTGSSLVRHTRKLRRRRGWW